MKKKKTKKTKNEKSGREKSQKSERENHFFSCEKIKKSSKDGFHGQFLFSREKKGKHCTTLGLFL